MLACGMWYVHGSCVACAWRVWHMGECGVQTHGLVQVAAPEAAEEAFLRLLNPRKPPLQCTWQHPRE